MHSPRSLVIRVATIAALCAAYLVPALPAAATPADAAGTIPGLTLAAEVSGNAAVAALGDKLPAVAQAHGRTAAELAKALRSDASLHVDRAGRLVYKEAPLAAGDTAALAGSGLVAPSAPLSETFKLHSKPGAKRTIYLDFDGHTLSGTRFNHFYNADADIVAPAWDVSGDPSVFTDAERTLIQQAWKRVAEDYAAFDVDVTTELVSEDTIYRSSLADDVFGQRVLVSPISGYFGAYGGLSAVGTFGDVGEREPSLVFPERLSNAEKPIGEAASHEAGHALNLLHKGTTAGATYYSGNGTGETAWAPIMGVGYSKNVTQWSKGEYPGANNLDDELWYIQNQGLSFRADDFADVAATAVRAGSGTGIDAAGVIGKPGDADVLAIVAGDGPLTLTAAPAAVGPNLDIALELRDASGALVAAANPTGVLGATLGATVSAGTYYLTVLGAGNGDPATVGYSNYASFGQWILSGTVADPGTVVEPPVPPVVVPNVAPTAGFTTSVTSGIAPLAVAFDAALSTDSDGVIAGYAWDFGDGATAQTAQASHTFSQPGTYTVTLTVTDNDGATGTAAGTVVVSPAPLPKMHVAGVTVTVTTTKAGKVAKATVQIVDETGKVVPGATVTGTWSGAVTGTSTAVTGADGRAFASSKTYKKTGSVAFTVTSVTKSGLTYDAGQNIVTRGSYAAAAISPRYARLR